MNFYSIMRVVMQLVLRVFFRRVFLAGDEVLQPKKPTILACNHPNSFLDAILLAVLLPRPLHFLARSDVFNTPFKRWLLSKLHLIPIYRLQEGAANLSKNEDTFALCYDILRQHGTILIFSEGICVQEKRLRPLKKGTARLAFGAETREAFTLGLEIIPVSLSYTQPGAFRQEVLIQLGEPLRVKEFEALYQQNAAAALLAFNRQLAARLKANLVLLEAPTEDQQMESLLALFRHDWSYPYFTWKIKTDQRLRQEQQVSKKLQEIYLTNKNTWQQVQTEVITYETALQGKGFTDKQIAVAGKKNNSLAAAFIFLKPIGEVLYIFNFLPFTLATWLTRRKVKKKEFYASVLLTLGFVLYGVYYGSLSLVILAVNPFWGIITAIGLPVTGGCYLWYYDARQSWLVLASSRVVQQLQAQRQAIQNIIYNIIYH